MAYDTLDSDQEYSTDSSDESYDSHEMQEMLDSLVDSDNEYAEARRKKKQQRHKQQQKKNVPTAKGASQYKDPPSEGFFTRKEAKELAARLGEEDRRNAQGILALNGRLGTLTNRVDDIVTVNTVQSRTLGKLDRQLKLTGALEFAQSYNLATQSLDPLQLLKGAVGYGAFGDTKGAFSNPLVIGGLGFLLSNPSIVSNLIKPPGQS